MTTQVVRPPPIGPRCSFCGKAVTEVRRLIAAPDEVYICDECIRHCTTILEEEAAGLAPTYPPEGWPP